MLARVRLTCLLPCCALLACTSMNASPDAGVAPDASRRTTRDVPVLDGEGTLEMALPDDTGAVQLVLQGAPLDVRIELDGWSSPTGVVAGVDAGRALTLAELEWSGSGRGLAGPCRTRAGYGAAAFLCPNSVDTGFTGGHHTVHIRAMQRADGNWTGWSGMLHAAITRAGPPPDRERILDVTLHLPDGVTIADAVQTRAMTLLSAGGVRPEFTQGAPSREELVLDEETLRSDALFDLVAESAGVDVFILRSLEVVDAEGTMRSVASMVTSLPSDVGGASMASLVLVNLGFAGMDDAQLGMLIAHELGHALGLFHPVEIAAGDGSVVVDPLEDTPVTADEAQSYLMHHTPREGSVRISDDEKTVLRRHPGLR